MKFFERGREKPPSFFDGPVRASRVPSKRADAPLLLSKSETAGDVSLVGPKSACAPRSFLPTLRRAWPRDGPEAAMCVQDVDVQCVLQFTLILAASCALHRRASRVIHCPKLFFRF